MKTRASIGELRNFGLLVGAIFALIFGLIAPWIHHGRVPLWPWALGLTLAASGTFAPVILRYPYLVWTRAGQALGWVNSRVVLNVLFFLIFLPAGMIARLARWDPLTRKFDPARASYRIASAPARPGSMEKPY